MRHSPAATVLLDEAQAHRDHAERARQMARQVSDAQSIERLEDFAHELETRAEDLEQRAQKLSLPVAPPRAPDSPDQGQG